VSVTVYTTPGNVYRVKNGKAWADMTSPTGELTVTVFDRETGDPDSPQQARELAAFGSVEAVGLSEEVEDVTGREEPEPPKKPFGL
jgi:predicted metal-dependent enzyme (double-stranded beta helix superfamily)